MKVRPVATLLGVLIAGCGGSSAPAHVDLSGKTPAAGADAAAHAVCTREAQCGTYSTLCQGGGAAGGASTASAPATTCTATFEPIPYDHCYEEASSDIEKLLACPALTAADVDMLETCFDTLATATCPTAADAEARAQAEPSGTTPPAPEIPAACALLMHPPAGC